MAAIGTSSSSEEAQLAQTVEMFEVITQSQPQDYQSLEILREAYVKLGREQDVINTSKRIANAYVLMGQFSSAILEYESILQKYPDDPDAMAGLSDIESLAGGINSLPNPTENTEVVKSQPKPAKSAKSGHTTALAKRLLKPDEIDEGRKSFHKLFVESKAIASNDFDSCWPSQDYHSAPTQVVEPFLQALADKNVLPVDKALNILSFSPKKGAVIIKKVLLSAIANAEHNDGADVDELRVKTIYVDKAENLRRFTARAKGRSNVILKQTCHIHVVVGDGK